MFRKSLTLLALAGIVAYVQPQRAEAQDALVCFDVNEQRAVQERNATLLLPQIIQRLAEQGRSLSSDFTAALCRTPEGTIVFLITDRSGGGVVRLVVDASSGEILPGP